MSSCGRFCVCAGRASHSDLHPRKQRSSMLSLSHILGTPSNKRHGRRGSSSSSRTGLVVSKQQNAAAAAQAGMAYRHTHLAHNGTANAVVAHVQDGVEVVHLYSGNQQSIYEWWLLSLGVEKPALSLWHGRAFCLDMLCWHTMGR